MLQKTMLVWVVCLALGLTTAYAHDAREYAGRPQNAGGMAPAALSQEDKARQYFTDLPVLTQEGEERRFYTDVLKDRVVLMTTFYTNCTGMCPLTNATLAQVQTLLGDELGKTFFLLSVSLDPKHDTPAVLKQYADKFGARAGWLFLTGRKESMTLITHRLGQTSTDLESHEGLFILGNVQAAHWRKLRPNVPAAVIVTHLRQLAGQLPID